MCVTEVSRQVQYEIIYVQFRLNEFRCYEAKIEEVKRPPGVEPRTPFASALPLSHDSWTTTYPHITLYVLHRWFWMPQSHTWQPLSMCHQNSIRGRLVNSLHQERTCAEWFSHSKCSEHLASSWKYMNTYRRLWGLLVVRLSWLSGRALAAQASGWVRLLAADCLFIFLYFRLITSKSITWGKMLWEYRLMCVYWCFSIFIFSVTCGMAGNPPTY